MHGRSLAATLAVLLSLALPAAASAITVPVNAAGDAPDLPGGDCDVDAGTAGNQCTLRAAVGFTNANGNPDELDFIVFTTALTPPITLAAPITVTQKVSIQSLEEPVAVQSTGAPHAGLVFAASAAGSAVFAIDDEDDDGTLSFSGFSTAVDVDADDVTVAELSVDDSSGDGIAVSGSDGSVFDVVVTDSGGFGVRLDTCATFVENTVGPGNVDGMRAAGSDCVIGSTNPGEGNVISGNDDAGLIVAGAGTNVHDNTIEGNGGVGVGVEAAGAFIGGSPASDAPNRINDNGSHGVALSAGATGTDVISNEITGNGGSGVFVPVGASADVSANTIAGNALIGIDTAAGPAAPTIAEAGASPGVLQVRLSWAAATGQTYDLEIFRSADCPPPGGVGEELLQAVSVISASSGTATVNRTISASVDVGEHITATVTHEGETSEFSTCETITDVPSVAFALETATGGEGGNATLTVTRSGDLTEPSSVSYATAADGTAEASDFTAVSGTVSFAAGDASETITVPIAQDTLPELAETFSVTLSNPVGATLATPSGATVTIVQSDVSPLTVTTSGSENDGVCEPADCTLADAITAATSDPGATRSPISFLDELDITLTMPPPPITEPVTFIGPASIDADGTTGLVVNAGTGDAGRTQLFDGVSITGTSGPALIVQGAEVLVQNATLSGARFATGATGSIGTLPEGANTITGLLTTESGSAMNIGENELQGGVRVLSGATRLFRNTITGGLALETCGDDQVITGNTADGVTISGDGCLFGGTAAGNGNTVTGSAGPGVLISGVDADLLGNTITGNAGAGVAFTGAGTARLLANGIAANGGLGIDAGADGQPSGPRATVASVTREGGGLRVQGTLPAGQGYVLELFSSPQCDPSGSGEGATPLGTALVAAAAAGGGFDVVVAGDTPAGSVATATLTGNDQATTEFSACAAVADGPAGPGPGPGPGAGPGPGPEPTFDPQSSISSPKGTKRARKVKAIKGAAVDAERVQVAVTRKGARCKALTAKGKLKRRSCSTPRWLVATGTSAWKLKLAKRLPPGRYVIRSRATAPDGTVETTVAKRTVRLRR